MSENKILDTMWDDNPIDITQEANFIWSIANKLRGSYMPDKYGDVVIPMTILRRFECALEATKQAVLKAYQSNPNYPSKALCKIAGFSFYNTSEYDLKELCNDSKHIAANFKNYISGFSANVKDIFAELEMDKHIDKMEKDGCLYSVVEAFSVLDLSIKTYDSIFFDGIYYKVRKDSKVVNKCVYSVLGIDEEGKKDILGIWIGENESAAFWTTIFNELKNRGVKDILIACHDNLSGFSNALSTVFPKTENQLCIIHMIRNSTKFVSYKDIKPIMADLKKVYGAVNEEAALYALEEFKEKWDSKYPQIYKMWESNWTDLSGFFKYPTEMRRLIYTTNAVEGFHRMLRKFTKTKTNFPTDDSLKKSIYLSVKEISKKWNNPVRDWGKIIGQFMMFFEERFGEIRTA